MATSAVPRRGKIPTNRRTSLRQSRRTFSEGQKHFIFATKISSLTGPRIVALHAGILPNTPAEPAFPADSRRSAWSPKSCGQVRLSVRRGAVMRAIQGEIGQVFRQHLPLESVSNWSRSDGFTAGSNGSCGGTYFCTAVPGCDGPMGVGAPSGITAFYGGPERSSRPERMVVVFQILA